jgi:glycosyltransferase involved in cell wall biosynthesis
MARILRIINRFNVGGPTYNATFLTRFLEDHETMLVGGMPEEGEKDSLYILEEYGVNARILKSMVRTPGIASDRKAYKEIIEIIKEFKPDIVHTHAAKAGALGRKAAKKCGVPVIVHTFHGHVFHSYFGSIKSFLYKAVERHLAKKSTAIIAISPAQKVELCSIYKIAPVEKTHVIPLGFDLTKFRQQLPEKRKEIRAKFGLREDDIAVAIIGRLAPIKNHTLFVDAIGKLSDQGITPRVFIVGNGSEYNSILNKVSLLNDQKKTYIELTDWITDIASFNAGMDIICLSSNNEGTPVSLIEAQACNVPVVTTDVGGVKDIVLDGETGFIVPPKNVDLYAEKLGILIKNKEIRLKMSQNCWSYVENKYHYSRLVNDMDKLYNQLLKKPTK